MTPKERLKIFLESQNLTIQKFEISLNLKIGFYDKLKNTISTLSLQRIVIKYPTLNLNWLLFGNGNMLLINDDNSHTKTLKAEDVFLAISSIIQNQDTLCGLYQDKPNILKQAIDQNPHSLFNDMKIQIKGQDLKIFIADVVTHYIHLKNLAHIKKPKTN